MGTVTVKSWMLVNLIVPENSRQMPLGAIMHVQKVGQKPAAKEVQPNFGMIYSDQTAAELEQYVEPTLQEYLLGDGKAATNIVNLRSQVLNLNTVSAFFVDAADQALLAAATPGESILPLLANMKIKSIPSGTLLAALIAPPART